MMANSTSTDAIFGGAGCNKMAAKQEKFYSTATASKQINEIYNQSCQTLDISNLIYFEYLINLWTLQT